MKLTKKLPTEPGWYWILKSESTIQPLSIRRIYNIEDVLWLSNGEFSIKLEEATSAHKNVMFAGPIEEPEYI